MKHLWKSKSGIYYYQTTHNGRRYKFSLDTSDEKEARKDRDKYDLMLKVQGHISFTKDEPGAIVFGEACVSWFSFKKKVCRQDTLTTYKNVLNGQLLKTPFVNKPVSEIEPYEIEEWIADLSCSSNTINGWLNMLSNIFKWCRKRHYVKFNPVEDVDRPKKTRTLPEAFSLDEVEMIIDGMDDHYKDYTTTKFFTGLRSSEINAVIRADLSLDRRILKVRRSVVKGITDDPKNAYSKRDVALCERAFQAVRRQVIKMMERGSQTLFFNTRGDPIDVANYGQIWRRVLKNAGVPYRPSKNTRATCCTLMLDAGLRPIYVAKQLGWADTAMINLHYQGYLRDESDDGRLDAYILHKEEEALPEAAPISAVSLEKFWSASGS